MDLAITASKNALEMAGVDGADIDLVRVQYPWQRRINQWATRFSPSLFSEARQFNGRCCAVYSGRVFLVMFKTSR